MSANTKIEWTDHTFNPWEGCQKVGPGCEHCYAETRNARFSGGVAINWGPGAERRRTSAANWKKPLQWNTRPFYACNSCGWRGHDADMGSGLTFTSGIPSCPHCDSLDIVPARPRVFCASLADVFDNAVPQEWRDDLWHLIEETPNLDWLLLTKRIGNAGNMLPVPFDFDRLYPNVWLGATICNREEMLRDAPKLKSTPAAVRFWSVEPMLGDLGEVSQELMPNWVICGGESGSGARITHPYWSRSLRDQCAAAGVPFLYKQHGEWLATTFCTDEQAALPYRELAYIRRDGTVHDGAEGIDFFGGDEEVTLVGKKAAGRLLDGVQHDGFPEVV